MFDLSISLDHLRIMQNAVWINVDKLSCSRSVSCFLILAFSDSFPLLVDGDGMLFVELKPSNQLGCLVYL